MYLITSSLRFVIFTVTVSTFGIFCDGSSIQSTVHFEEENVKGSFVVNVAELFKADKLQLLRGKLTFQLLSQKLEIDSMKSELRPTRWVQINSKTGVMTSSRRIDRDAECKGLTECIVHIQVVMLPQVHFTFLDLYLVIDDVNDNPPTFDDDVIVLKIKENYDVGKFYNLDAFHAEDADSENNSKTRYELSSNPYFSLEQTNRLKLKLEKTLDYEKETEVSMTLSAIDEGNPSFTTQVGLKVLVEDVNDNSPIFDQKEYKINLLENTSPGHVIGNVTARDADSGSMGDVKYYISTRNDDIAREMLSINPENGKLTLRERVDREKHDGTRILIQARDSDTTNQRIGEAWLDITVEDVNDNSPVINTVFILHHTGNIVYILESAAKGTFLMKISASDRDSGNNGRVNLEMQSNSFCGENKRNPDKDTFLLHSDGLLATSRNLDREACDKYVIKILACDYGNPAKCTTDEIKVVVLDENEFAPKFRAPVQHVTVREDISPGTVVTTVRAYDQDSEGSDNPVVSNEENDILVSKNGVVNYKITGGDRIPFSLNRKNGEIRLLKPLDREIKNEWRIKIKAQDGAISSPRESSCTVIIRVADVNDNAPQFSNPKKNNTLIYASTVEDKVITKFLAKDPDFGTNGKIRFRIISENHLQKNTSLLQRKYMNTPLSTFVLNPTSGELRLNFSRENKTNLLGIYILKIQAYDLGIPRQRSEIVVNISVSDSPIQYLNYGNLMAKEDKFFLLAICVGSAFILLLGIITIILVIRHRRNRKESKVYTLSVEKNDDVIKRDDGIDVTSALCTSIEKEDNEVKDEVGEKKTTTTSRLVEESQIFDSKMSEQDMEYLTVSRQNMDIASPYHWDNDSGRGDSDADVFSCKHRRTPFPESDQTSKMGRNCTEQCMILGHSDSCWMPFTEFSPELSHRTSPQSVYLSNFYNQSYAANLRNPRSQFGGNNAEVQGNRTSKITSPARYHHSGHENPYSQRNISSQYNGMPFQSNIRASVASTSRLLSSIKDNSTTSHPKNVNVYVETTTQMPQQSPSLSQISLHSISRSGGPVYESGISSDKKTHAYVSNFESVLV